MGTAPSERSKYHNVTTEQLEDLLHQAKSSEEQNVISAELADRYAKSLLNEESATPVTPPAEWPGPQSTLLSSVVTPPAEQPTSRPTRSRGHKTRSRRHKKIKRITITVFLLIVIILTIVQIVSVLHTRAVLNGGLSTRV
jgi:hypothetical protein